MPTLKIDDVEIEVAPGTSILQAAEEIGIEIPRFCYHDRLSVPANCRMCLVEVTPGPPKPQASCALACADGMEVKTNSDMIKKARRGVMEMLLINHPLDCPICDQGGECDLQDQAVAYGFDRSRYHENKRAVPNKNIGPLIKTIMTRCIQCTRCVRFGEEIAGMTELGLLHRGEDVEIDTMIEKSISTELSGNMIDICPVGALTSKPYAFKARSWELTKTETIDVHDAVGSNIRVDSRGGEVLRVLPRLHEAINEEWIHDKTRFAYDGLGKRRLDRPWVRDEDTGKLREASWEEAFVIVADKLKTTNPENMAALAGDLCDLESMVALKDFMGGFGVVDMECRIDGSLFDTAVRSGYLFNSGIAGIESADSILLIGTNPRSEAAMINARIRKKWRRDGIPVGVIGEQAELTYPYEYLGDGSQGLETAVKKFVKSAGGAKPMVIVGMGAFQNGDGLAIHQFLNKAAKGFGWVTDTWNGFNVLHNAASRVGALDIGFVSENGFDLKKKKLVYLLGADDLPMSQIDKKAFVVYQGHHGDAGAHRADVILPGAAYTEKNGLYVNTEGRVQNARRAVHPPGEAREDWKILRALSGYCAKPLPYDSQHDLRMRIVDEWEFLGDLDVLPKAEWKAFGEKGKLSAKAFKSPIENFYMTNSISRASATMQECTEAFFNYASFAEAAE